MKDVIIRTARDEDLPALRALAVDTAYFGKPCEHFFPDRELLADLIMEYYARYEPEHTWVADLGGEVVGYLSAGFDEERYSEHMRRKILLPAVKKALARGKLWDRRTGRLAWYNLKAALGLQPRLKPADKKKYPVHIHQNVREGYRGMKLGTRLVEAFLAEVEQRKVGVRFRALRQEDRFGFFERYGFRRHDCRRAGVWEQWLGRSPLYFMEYVRDA